MRPSAMALRSHAFRSGGVRFSGICDVEVPLARNSCIPYLDERRRRVFDVDEKADVNSVTSASSMASDFVERCSSSLCSSLKHDLAVIAAHNAQLARAKFATVTTHCGKPVDNPVNILHRGVKHTYGSSAPSPPPLSFQHSGGLWITASSDHKQRIDRAHLSMRALSIDGVYRLTPYR